MTTASHSKPPPSNVPRYAILLLGIAGGVLLIVPLVFYLEVGKVSAFSHSPDDWVQFATYFGGVAGPPLALIASWLVVVTVRESLNKTTEQTHVLRKQMSIQRRQLSIQKGEATLTLSLDVHRNILKQIGKSLDIAAFVKGIEDEALGRLWEIRTPPWSSNHENAFIEQLRSAYIQDRSLYEAQINLYMSSVRLCIGMLFELDTGEAVSKKSMQSSSGPTTIPINVYLAMLSEEETRLLLLEAAASDIDGTFGAMLSWAKVRKPIINGWMIMDMSDNIQALHDGYGAIQYNVALMRTRYISS